MRGPRFGRPPAKKASAREKKEKRGTLVFYQEPERVDPAEVYSKTLNAIEHLGNQRFALPPFSEHFDRWMKDVRAVLTEFETSLPAAIDPQYRTGVEQSLSKVQEVLTRSIEEEKNSSTETANLQQQIAAVERQISSLEQDYKKRIREVRKKYEASVERLRTEIDSLDKQRLRILRKKTSFLRRLFGKSESELEEKTTSTLHKKRAALDEGKGRLKQELEKDRTEYENNRKHLVDELEALRAKHANLRGNTLDDAVEARRLACQELHKVVGQAVARIGISPNSHEETTQ
jgi:chromosome segregation ATPase